MLRKLTLFTAVSSSQIHLEVTAEHQHISFAQTKVHMCEMESPCIF